MAKTSIHNRMNKEYRFYIIRKKTDKGAHKIGWVQRCLEMYKIVALQRGFPSTYTPRKKLLSILQSF